MWAAKVGNGWSQEFFRRLRSKPRETLIICDSAWMLSCQLCLSVSPISFHLLNSPSVCSAWELGKAEQQLVLFLDLYIDSLVNAQTCACPFKDCGKTSGVIITLMFIMMVLGRSPLWLPDQRNSLCTLPRLSHGTLFPRIAQWYLKTGLLEALCSESRMHWTCCLTSWKLIFYVWKMGNHFLGHLGSFQEALYEIWQMYRQLKVN